MITGIKVLVSLITYTYQDLIDNSGYHKNRKQYLFYFIIFTLSDLGVLSNVIG